MALSRSERIIYRLWETVDYCFFVYEYILERKYCAANTTCKFRHDDVFLHGRTLSSSHNATLAPSLIYFFVNIMPSRKVTKSCCSKCLNASSSLHLPCHCLLPSSVMLIITMAVQLPSNVYSPIRVMFLAGHGKLYITPLSKSL